MKKILIFVLLAVVLVGVLTGCKTSGTSEYGKEIITGGENGAFDYEKLSELRAEWTLTSGSSSSDVFSLVDNGANAANFLKINTTGTGYAQVSRMLYLKTYSYYKVSYTYTTSTMTSYETDVNYIGLYVGFAESPDFNIGDENRTVEMGSSTTGTDSFYFKTEGLREVTLTINVGTEDNPVSCSNVTLKSINLVRVTKGEVEEKGESAGFYTLTPAIYDRPSVLNLSYVIAGAIVTLVIAYAFYMLRARNIALEPLSKTNAFYAKIKESKALGLVLAICAALTVRLLIIILQAVMSGREVIQTVYYGFDLTNFSEYGKYLANYGPTYFFEYNEGAQFLPFAGYIMTIAGLFGRLIGLVPGATDATVILTTATVIKLLAALADVGTVVIIYKIIAAKHGNVAGTIFAAFYALIPITFLLSGYIGSFEAFTIFFAALTFYFILNKNYIGMAIACFTACMFTPSALLIVPAVLMYTIMLIINSIKDKNNKWIQPAVAIVSAVILYFLVSLPFFFTNVQGGDTFASFGYFIDIAKGGSVYTANAFNFQGLIGNNFSNITTASIFVTILFIVFVLALFAYAYFKLKNRLSLTMLAASFAFIYWFFCNSMQPNTVLLMLPLMLIYTGFINDKRLYALFSLLASFMFVNTAYVYMVAGYTEGGVTQISYDNTPIMYVMGALYIILVIAYVIIGYDTVITKNAKEQYVLRVTYGEYVKSLAENTVINIKNLGYKISGLFKAGKEAVKEGIASLKIKKD